MDTTSRATDQAFAVRTTSWSALLAVHTLVLAATFAAVLASRLPASGLITAIACLSLFGIVLILFLLVCVLARADQVQHPPQYLLTRFWAVNRPVVWHVAELLAVFAFLAAAACLMAAIVHGNQPFIAAAAPTRATRTLASVAVAVPVQGHAWAHWTTYVAAIGIPIIAAIAAWIAVRQFQAMRNRLRLDLFDKRMEIYGAVRDALGCITRQGNLTSEQKLQYLQGTHTARWLFAPDVAHYLDETLWRKIAELELHSTMSRDPAAPERARHIEERAETFNWILQQYSEFDALVAPYLTLGH